ncbi:MAG TPA: hypothetical protein VNW95_08610 [Mucilaginibacter sp.]|jgi:hypothetical protein|nr:hypothetical protein [Mucilaginibacter sp.]
MNKNDQEQTLDNSEEISLKELILKLIGWWHYLLSKWKIILISGIIGGGLGFTYAYLKKTIYKAELSFALQDEKPGGGLSGAAGLASQFGIDLGGASGGEFSGDNLLELMKSRSMVEKALLTTKLINGKKETLAEFYLSFNQDHESVKNNALLARIYFLPDADHTKFTLQQDSVLGVIHKTIISNNLTVDKLDKKLSIVYLKVNSTNELFSKYFAEALEKVVSDFYIQKKIEKSIKNVNILQRQTDSVRRALNDAISGVAASADVNPNPNPSRQTLRVPSQRKQVEVQANTIILSELIKNLEIAKMSLLQQTPLIQVIDSPILPLDKSRPSKIFSMLTFGVLCSFFMVVYLCIKRILDNLQH